MRIIGGIHKGRILRAPQGLPVRPTTDFAKEALFNILNNRIDFEELEVLDLFCGTGNISFEFASRGAKRVMAVDMHMRCLAYVQEEAKKLQLQQLATNKANIFKYLESKGHAYDLVFADPPYDIPNYKDLPELVMNNGWLKEDGILIVEHSNKTDLSTLPFYKETRKYGNVNFSFFEKS